MHPRGATTSAGAASAAGQREREESNESEAWGYTCDPKGGAGWASQSARSRLRAGGAETARKQHAPWGAGWGWGRRGTAGFKLSSNSLWIGELERLCTARSIWNLKPGAPLRQRCAGGEFSFRFAGTALQVTSQALRGSL